MMIATEVSVAKADWLAMLTASSANERTPTSRAGTIGTLALPDTRATLEPNGRRPSRAIENNMRMHAVHTASVHTVMATAEATRKTFPVVLPSACLTMYGRPLDAIFGSWMFLTDMSAKRMSRAPMVAAVASARRMAGGALRWGSLVSSARVPAGENP